MEQAVAMENHGDNIVAIRLAQVLSGIYAATMPMQERQRLSTSAVHRSLAMGISGEVTASKQVDNLHLLEQALATTASVQGVARHNITQAKAFLRARGEAQLASRLGRLSKARNTNAHPDAALLKDLMATAGKIEQTVHDETTLDISSIMAQTASEAALSDRGSNCAGMDFWASDSALTAEHGSQLNKGASSPHGESVGVPCESIHLQPVLVISAMGAFSHLGGDRPLATEGPPLEIGSTPHT